MLQVQRVRWRLLQGCMSAGRAPELSASLSTWRSLSHLPQFSPLPVSPHTPCPTSRAPGTLMTPPSTDQWEPYLSKTPPQPWRLLSQTEVGDWARPSFPEPSWPGKALLWGHRGHETGCAVSRQTQKGRVCPHPSENPEPSRPVCPNAATLCSALARLLVLQVPSWLCRTPGVTRRDRFIWTPSRITSCCRPRGLRRACLCSSGGPLAPVTPRITSSRWVAAEPGRVWTLGCTLAPRAASLGPGARTESQGGTQRHGARTRQGEASFAVSLSSLPQDTQETCF